MSYEILYGRQFIDLGNGRYIPMILSGSSNCTMFHDGREIRERYWWPFTSDDLLAAPAEIMIEWAEEQASKGQDMEWFRRGSKWMHYSDIPTWMKSGIASARTLDEITTMVPYQSLRCSISIYDESKSYGEKGYHRDENLRYIRHTEELIEWLKEYEEMKENKKENERCYPTMSFSGIEPLGLGVKRASDQPVICKINSRYLCDYHCGENGRYSYTCSSDISEAMVFENAEDFAEKTKGMLTFAKYRLINANQKEKLYVVAIETVNSPKTMYVKRKNPSKLSVSTSIKDAMRFTTEKAAQNYIDRVLVDNYPAVKTFRVEKIEEE